MHVDQSDRICLVGNRHNDRGTRFMHEDRRNCSVQEKSLTNARFTGLQNLLFKASVRSLMTFAANKMLDPVCKRILFAGVPVQTE
jgi:hypothetical protein